MHVDDFVEMGVGMSPKNARFVATDDLKGVPSNKFVKTCVAQKYPTSLFKAVGSTIMPSLEPFFCNGDVLYKCTILERKEAKFTINQLCKHICNVGQQNA